MRLTTQERELVRVLNWPSAALTVVSQFRGARASISAQRLERRYGGYHVCWDWQARWLPSVLKVRRVTADTWNDLTNPWDEKGFLKRLGVVLPILVAQWALMGAAFLIFGAYGVPSPGVAVSADFAAVATAGMSLFTVLRTRAVYIFDDVVESLPLAWTAGHGDSMQRSVLNIIDKRWGRSIRTVLLTSNEGLPECFLDTVVDVRGLTTLGPATVDEFVATLQRMAAVKAIPDVGSIDAAFVSKMCAVHGVWHGLSARFWALLPDEFFGPEPTCVLSRDVLLQVAVELDLNAPVTFRVMALCGSPRVRIAEFTEVASMIAEGDGAGLVKAARDLVGRDEVPRRMLLATLFVADFNRRGAAVAATGASKTLREAVDGIQKSNVEGEFLFHVYVEPLQRALDAVSPRAASAFWVKEGDATFEVTPGKNNIDALKEAVKAKLESSGRSTVDHLGMKVAKHDGMPCDKMSAPLEANTEGTAYVITLP
jgi:hypothetical protein